MLCLVFTMPPRPQESRVCREHRVDPTDLTRRPTRTFSSNVSRTRTSWNDSTRSSTIRRLLLFVTRPRAMLFYPHLANKRVHDRALAPAVLRHSKHITRLLAAVSRLEHQARLPEVSTKAANAKQSTFQAQRQARDQPPSSLLADIAPLLHTLVKALLQHTLV